MRKKNILVWGTGVSGQYVYRLIQKHRNYEVIAFGDNNESLCGKYKFGKPIINAELIVNFDNIDCIVIASQYWKEIREKLEKITSIPIYNNVNEIMYNIIAIDISGFCNARCKWCVTGDKNRNCNNIDTSYMSKELFEKVHKHLYDNKIIEKSTQISLYNWGEPLLNKDYEKIIKYCSEEEQSFVMSTNASVVRLLNDSNSYKTCESFIFSMPGFSQESYDRIHGFSFERIKNNIEQILNNIRENGFKGEAILSYHVYKFNVHEIEKAKAFAQKLGLKFNPYYPYFNGNSMTEKYLENTFSKKYLDEANEELFLNHVKDLLSQRPVDYRCLFENDFFVDCNANLVLCCASDAGCDNYVWDSIFDISSYDEMRNYRKKMLKSNTCNKCRELKIDYWMDKNPAYTIEA